MWFHFYQLLPVDLRFSKLAVFNNQDNLNAINHNLNQQVTNNSQLNPQYLQQSIKQQQDSRPSSVVKQQFNQYNHTNQLNQENGT